MNYNRNTKGFCDIKELILVGGNWETFSRKQGLGLAFGRIEHVTMGKAKLFSVEEKPREREAKKHIWRVISGCGGYRIQGDKKSCPR